MNRIRVFFPLSTLSKYIFPIVHFSQFLKKLRGGFPRPLLLVMRLLVNYWICINILNILFFFLNIFKNAWMSRSGYARLWIYWSSCMFDRILRMLWVVNVIKFRIWQGCKWKGYTESWICLNIVQYASIMPEYTLIRVNNMPNHGWILPECSQICLIKLFRQCQGSQYALSIYIFDRVLNIPLIKYQIFF